MPSGRVGDSCGVVEFGDEAVQQVAIFPFVFGIIGFHLTPIGFAIERLAEFVIRRLPRGQFHFMMGVINGTIENPGVSCCCFGCHVPVPQIAVHQTRRQGASVGFHNPDEAWNQVAEGAFKLLV